MRIEEFDFTLPPSLIAQYPSAQRGDSRLMVLHRCRGEIEHRAFQDIGEYLQPGDLLVMNNSRVLPARLIGKRETGGTCEVLLIPSHHGMRDECDILIKRSRKVKSGTRIHFGAGLEGEVQEVKNGKGRIRLTANGDLLDRLQEIGHIPLPPYIRRQDEPLDRERYQTVVAEKDGSIAAPTAGLHFTHGLLQRMRTQGVETALITLHVGIGTFAPVRVWNVEKHSMEPEWVDISEDVAHHIADTKQKGRRVIAVGTTTTRALESASDSEGRIQPGQRIAGLFIYPSYRFRVVDGLITNFHLPRSTLIMLVSAFAGREFVMRAYHEAIERKYRFYSYGDAMLIL